jgi:hypothetical protein
MVSEESILKRNVIKTDEILIEVVFERKKLQENRNKISKENNRRTRHIR